MQTTVLKFNDLCNESPSPSHRLQQHPALCFVSGHTLTLSTARQIFAYARPISVKRVLKKIEKREQVGRDQVQPACRTCQLSEAVPELELIKYTLVEAMSEEVHSHTHTHTSSIQRRKHHPSGASWCIPGREMLINGPLVGGKYGLYFSIDLNFMEKIFQ